MLVVIKAAATCSIWATAFIIRGKADLVPHFLGVERPLHPSDDWILWNNDGQHEAHDGFLMLPNRLQIEDHDHPAIMESNFPSIPPIGSPSLSYPYLPLYEDEFNSIDLTSHTIMGNEIPVMWGDHVFGNHVNLASPSSYPEHVPFILPHPPEQSIASLEERLTREVVQERSRQANWDYSHSLLTACIPEPIRGAGVRPPPHGKVVRSVTQAPSTTDSPPGPSGIATPRRSTSSRKKIAKHRRLPPAETQPFENPVHESPTTKRGTPAVAQQDTQQTKTLEPENHSQPEIEIPSSDILAIERRLPDKPRVNHDDHLLSESANKEDMPRGKRPTTRVPRPPKTRRLVDIDQQTR